MNEETRQCSQCQKVKSVSEFYRNGKYWRSACKECHRGKMTERYWEDEDRSEKARAKRQRNREWYESYSREYYMQNRERFIDYNRKHFHENHERMLEVNRVRKQARRALERISPVDRHAVIERDNATCYLCGKVCTPGFDLTIDHVVPISKGGTHTLDNLRVCCRSCNSKKRTKLVN